jgi:GAF domain-containing protein
MDADPADRGASSEAAATIARQQAEIEHLRQRVASDGFARDLRDALTVASATGTIGAPVSHTRLLKMIVVTAADIIEATAASLFLLDAEQQNLVFWGLLQGDKFPEHEQFRIPLGEGVAGLVALTAQPVAISDSTEDIDAADIAQALGYVPKNILCVPLAFEDHVIGVLQFMNKEKNATFSVEDMEAVGLFANLAAVAIEQSRTHSRMGALLAQLVEGVDGVPDYDRHGLTERARAFTAELGQQTGYLDALDLARLVQEIVHHGDAATDACKGILDGFVEFLRARPTTTGQPGGPRW